MTNYEKIKAMSVEEMADWLTFAQDVSIWTYDGWVEYLESEVEEDG